MTEFYNCLIFLQFFTASFTIVLTPQGCARERIFSMKEQLYTIPLNDAVNAQDECPFCFIHRSIEQDLLDFVLGSGSSYMEADIREQTDKAPQQTGAGKRLSPRQRRHAPARWRRSAAPTPALRHTASGRKAPPIRAGLWSARAGRRPARASAVRRARPSASRWRPAARQSPGRGVRTPKAPHCSGAGRREPPIIFRTSAGKPYRPVPDCVF